MHPTSSIFLPQLHPREFNHYLRTGWVFNHLTSPKISTFTKKITSISRYFMEMSWTCPENSSILWAFHARNQRLFPVSSHLILLPPAVAGAPQAAMTTSTPRTSFGPGRCCWDRPWGWLPGGKTTLGKCHGSLADQKHLENPMTLVTLENVEVLVEKKWLQHYIGLGWWGTWVRFRTRLLGWWNLRFNGGKTGRFLHRNKAASRKYHSTD